MKNQNIIFFGSGDYTIPIVKKLLEHNLKLVVSIEKESKLEKFCKSKGIEFTTDNLKDENTKKRIQNLNPSVAILASYGAFVPKGIINKFKNGIINIHPSLLPKWKGPSPIQYTLLNSDTQTGVTLIKLDNEIDHGPIISQQNYELNGTETAKELLDILFSQGAEMVEKIIVKLENGEALKETPQDHSKESWSYKINKKDGEINLNSIPTSELEIKNYKLEIARKVRAYYPWPGVWLKARIKNQELRIKLLPNSMIQPENKNPMNYKDFINGYGDEGERLLIKLNLI